MTETAAKELLHVDQGNITSSVHQILRHKIIQGELAPGSKINQNKIAKELGVSRTPIIKALYRLEAEGLVNSINQSGFFVHQLTAKELADLFALREGLESIVVSDIVGFVTDDQINELDQLFNQFEGSNWTKEDWIKYWEVDQTFHSRLFDMCHNDLAKKVEETFQVLKRTFRGGLVREPQETVGEHKAIIQALRQRDADAARQASIEHNLKTRKFLLNMIENLDRLGLESKSLPIQDVPGRFWLK